MLPDCGRSAKASDQRLARRSDIRTVSRFTVFVIAIGVDIESKSETEMRSLRQMQDGILDSSGTEAAQGTRIVRERRL